MPETRLAQNRAPALFLQQPKNADGRTDGRFCAEIFTLKKYAKRAFAPRRKPHQSWFFRRRTALRQYPTAESASIAASSSGITQPPPEAS